MQEASWLLHGLGGCLCNKLSSLLSFGTVRYGRPLRMRRHAWIWYCGLRIHWCVCVVAVVCVGVLFSETMRSVLFVAVSFFILRDAAAFSPAAPVAVGANLRATANTARGRRIRSAMRPVLSMAGEQPQQVIDFGKVGFTEADNQVFTWPALSLGTHYHHCTLSVGDAIPSCSSFQNSEPPWWRG